MRVSVDCFPFVFCLAGVGWERLHAMLREYGIGVRSKYGDCECGSHSRIDTEELWKK